MNSDVLISKINKLEHWLEQSKGNKALIPARIGGYGFLILVMMVSNTAALFRWPVAEIGRLISKPHSQELNSDEKSEPINVDGESLQQLIASQDLLLVDFWAEWCGPCVMMNNSLTKLAIDNENDCKVAKVNTVKNPKIAQSYHVKGLPTLILFKDGKENKRHAGALSLSELQTFISSR